MNEVAKRPYLSIVVMALGCWALIIGVASTGWAVAGATGVKTAVAAETPKTLSRAAD